MMLPVATKLIKQRGGSRYMPIRLKKVLADYKLTQADWGAAVIQKNGKPLSCALGSQILNWGLWPKTTPREDIKSQTLDFLESAGVNPSCFDSLWDELPSNQIEDSFKDRKSRDVHGVRVENVTSSNFGNELLLEAEMLTQRARKHFGLFRDPFTDDVQEAADVYLSSDQRYIRNAMFDAAKHGGFIAVIGESGAGKSVLRRDLIDRVIRDEEDIVIIQPQIIDKAKLTAASICDAIIGDLSNTERPKQSLEAKSRQAQRLLQDSSRAGNKHALIIEEAQDLGIVPLKHLKRFWEFEDGFTRLLGIILIGQPELKNKLDEHQHWEAREVIRRCEIAELEPLDGHVEDYLRLKFSRIGANFDEIFDESAFSAIRERLTTRRGNNRVESMVYPLVVNIMVTKALNLAASTGSPLIDADVIRGI